MNDDARIVGKEPAKYRLSLQGERSKMFSLLVRTRNSKVRQETGT